MDKFTELLSNQFGTSLPEDFQRRALYYRQMDFLEYVAQDTTVIADRVDSFLTVLWNDDQSQIIGFRCKGFGYVFQEIIKPAMKLDNKDFNPIVFALEAIFTRVGERLFDGLESDDDPHRELAYRKSLELVKRDNVTLPIELQAA